MNITKLIIAGSYLELYRIDDISFLEDPVFIHYKKEITEHKLVLTFFHKDNSKISDKDIKKINTGLTNIINKLQEPLKNISEEQKEKALFVNMTKLKNLQVEFFYDINKFTGFLDKIDQHLYSMIENFLIEEGIIGKDVLTINKENINLLKKTDKYKKYENDKYELAKKEEKEYIKEKIKKLSNIPVQNIKFNIFSEEWFYEESIIDSGLNPVIVFYTKELDRYEHGMPMWAVDKINKAIDNTNSKFSKKVIENVDFEYFVNNGNNIRLEIYDTPHKQNFQKTSLDIKILLPIFINELEKLDFYTKNGGIYDYESEFNESCVFFDKKDKNFSLKAVKEEFPEWNLKIKIDDMSYSNLINPKQKILDLIDKEIFKVFKKTILKK